MEFKHVEDVIDWLEPMDYEEFWREIRPFCLVMLPRDHCDESIEAGVVEEDVVLDVVKNMARLELTAILKLTWSDGGLEMPSLH